MWLNARAANSAAPESADSQGRNAGFEDMRGILTLRLKARAPERRDDAVGVHPAPEQLAALRAAPERRVERPHLRRHQRQRLLARQAVELLVAVRTAGK